MAANDWIRDRNITIACDHFTIVRLGAQSVIDTHQQNEVTCLSD